MSHSKMAHPCIRHACWTTTSICIPLDRGVAYFTIPELSKFALDHIPVDTRVFMVIETTKSHWNCWRTSLLILSQFQLQSSNFEEISLTLQAAGTPKPLYWCVLFYKKNSEKFISFRIFLQYNRLIVHCIW